ncbi:MAG TPA: beta-hexosaminidase [Clostridiales bacterium]|nr:beta-hexosaminidase [Clostridiales bacterium]
MSERRELLTAAPFRLDGKQADWVEDTLASMSTEDRLRQLFCLITYSNDEEDLRRLAEQVRPGGIMSRAVPTEQALRTIRTLQEYSHIPMLISANLESGGNGLLSDGSFFARPMAIAATDDTEQARRLGEICGTEGAAVGANWSFAPIVDIDYNWRNPITNTRTFGSDPERVRRMGVAYVTELQKHGMAACCKHFPGDGRDERDQHIAPSVNDLSCGEWDRTYGMVYRAMIAAGVMSVMIGHILLPAYSRRFVPDLRDSDLLPASVSYELVTKLLREQLGFNGLIVTDSSTMAGVTALIPRDKLVPMSIAAGCDMFLFTKDLEEDIGFMTEGLRRGILTEERLAEAVTRILALKAALRLPEKREAGRSVPRAEDAKRQVGQPLFAEWSRTCADRSVTLVKEESGVLPLTPERYPRVLFCPLDNRSAGQSFFTAEGSANKRFRELLAANGFDVTVFEPAQGMEGFMTPVRDIVGKYDLIVYSAELVTRSNQTVVRPEWSNPMGANVPVWCHSVPTVFVSFENPYHLVDVPQMRTFVNCYGGSETVVRAAVDKLMGKSRFQGKSPVDPFCGKWEAKIAGFGVR